MSQPFEIDNTKRLYLLETDETYSIDSFKITHYFEISDLQWKSEKTQESFPSAGRLNVNVNKAFKIEYDDNNGNVTNREVLTEYNKTYESNGKKLFLINEEIIDSNNVQYLYSNEYDNEKTFEIQSRKIELNKCKKQPFETFMEIELADDDFIKRVKAVKTYLNPLKDRIRSLYEDIQDKKDKKIGGSKHTLNIDGGINKMFHSMIDLYIKCVNEILNVSLFKKVFYISHISNIKNDSGEDQDIETASGLAQDALKRIKQFNYVGISFDTLGHAQPDKLDMNYKEYFSGLYQTNNKTEDINHIFSEIVNKDNKIAEHDQVFKKDYLIEKYRINDYDLDNMKIYNVKYFVDVILKPIAQKENYHKIYKDNQNNEKKRLSEFFYFILKIIEKEMKSIHLLLYQEIEHNEKHSLLVENLKKIETQKKINHIIGQQIDTNILTYLKIRNDQHGQGNYNARFRIKLHTPSTDDSSRRVMELNYSDDNKEYYKKNEDGQIEPKENNELYTIEEKDDYNIINANKRDNHPRKYVFGEFNKIFTPEKRNKDIAEQAIEITNNLKEGRPVFIIGYGASGAGKTSSLIYFNQQQEDGILVEICNIMGREGYINASIKSCEIYRDASVKNAKKDITKNPETFNGRGISFSYDNGFKLDNDLEYENHHIFRARKQEQRKKEKEIKERGEEVETLTIDKCEKSITTTFAKGSQLGEYLIHIIDTDRHVKATTNNPNSSRSHSLVFVKLSGGGKEAHLIVGDFAGVENVFNCDDPSVLNDFMKIEADDGSGLFYKNEVCDGKLDPIGNTAEKKRKEKEMTGGKNSYKFGEYLNDQPFSYSKFGQLSQLKDTIQEETILYQYFGNVFKENKNIQMFERAVRLIRSIANIPLEDGGEEKDLIGPKDVLTFETYSQLENSENNVWKKAKDDWEKYKSTVTYIQELYASNETEAKKNTMNDSLKNYIDKTILELQNHKGFTFPSIKGPAMSKPVTLSSRQITFPPKKKADGPEHDIDNLFLILETFIDEDTELKQFLGVDKENLVDEAIANLSTNSEIYNKETLLIAIRKMNGKQLDNKNNPTDSDYLKKAPLEINQLIALALMNDMKSIFKNQEGKKSEFESKLKSFLDKITENSLQATFNSALNNEKLFQCGDLDFLKNIVKNKEDYKKEKEFIDAILGNETELGPIGIYLIELELYTYEKLALATEVCSNRRQEGYLINNSLAGVRDMIRNILQAKNQSTLQLVPNYINICFDRYCPTHTNCFSFDTRDTKQNTNDQDKRVIQETLTEYLKSNGKEINELVIGIFCVFNISQTANNPPPVPYVDINDLKRIVFNYNLFSSRKSKEGKKKIHEFILCARELLNTIDNKFINTYKVGDSEQEKNLLESLKTGEPVKGFKELKLKDYQGNIIDKEYYLYDIFKFLLSQLLPGNEVIRTVEEEINIAAKEVAIKMEKSDALKKLLYVNQLNQLKKKEEEANQDIKTSNNEIERTSREIQINEKHREELTRLYRVSALEKLIRFLELDLERLKIADESVTDYDRDGYDPTIIYNKLDENDKQILRRNYSDLVDRLDGLKDYEQFKELDKVIKADIYDLFREYIEFNIQALYLKVFGKRESDAVFILNQLFDIDMLKIVKEDENTNKRIGDILNTFHTKEKEKAAEEKAKAEAEEEKEREREYIREMEDKPPIKNYRNNKSIKDKWSKGLKSDKVSYEQKERLKSYLEYVDKYGRFDNPQPFDYKMGGGPYLLTKQTGGVGELTLTNLSEIIKFIGMRKEYFRRDAYNYKKIGELEEMINIYEDVIDKLKFLSGLANEEIMTYTPRITMLEEDLNKKEAKVAELKDQKKLTEEDIKNLKEEYKTYTEKAKEKFKNLEMSANDDTQKGIVTAFRSKKQNETDISRTDMSKTLMAYLEDFLTSIDNLSAASAVGTLEFLDKMAKLNTVSTICNFNNDKINQEEVREKIGYDLQDLYSSNERNDSDDIDDIDDDSDDY